MITKKVLCPDWVRKISHQLCLSRKTVAKYIETPDPQRNARKRASKLDPFKNEIAKVLRDGF